MGFPYKSTLYLDLKYISRIHFCLNKKYIFFTLDRLCRARDMVKPDKPPVMVAFSTERSRNA
jgi:hypothetical protein